MGKCHFTNNLIRIYKVFKIVFDYIFIVRRFDNYDNNNDNNIASLLRRLVGS